MSVYMYNIYIYQGFIIISYAINIPTAIQTRNKNDPYVRLQLDQTAICLCALFTFIFGCKRMIDDLL